MNVVPRIMRRSCKMGKTLIRNMTLKPAAHSQRRTPRVTKLGGIYPSRTRSSSKVPSALKVGYGIPAVLGAYFTYLAIIYGRQYMREKSRPFNAFSTSDDVMKDVNLSGKYAIVTGCNTGIGKETVRSMVKAGATVVMACRNLEKAQKAKDDIIATFDNNNNDDKKDKISERLIIMQLDLGSLQSVYDFSKAFVESGLKCDYVVNNAGVMVLPEYVTTKENIERQWGMLIVYIYIYYTYLCIHVFRTFCYRC